MMLLIDAGNTRIKLGWLDPISGRRETDVFIMAHNDLSQLPTWLDQLCHVPIAAIGVNVAGTTVAQRINDFFKSHYAFEIRWIVSQGEAAGIRNGYDAPSQLGADRWLSMIGLAQHTNDAAILASFGTATTIDTLGPKAAIPGEPGIRQFYGGLIFPGPELMRASLAAGTANLPKADGTTAAFPTHTHQAISSGIAAAQAGALLRQWREGLSMFGGPPQVFSTGGGWGAVEIEAQRLLNRAQTDLGLPAQAIQCLTTPVLDGLAHLAPKFLN
ncbi:type III pantothenate kinase [Candidimonas sp. SYP-B2681]|uniref:type III pantothenate kinase n=1 Tax=Candidimonas sp. SYP-B2681 TaxID=2497686 RepID=UPI000F86227F|nr:type III pantothenate kinase [Candidimonas sp. SYP-B2681]RTZ45651.1 type III pantothenate kinase [Candidimonas sp. SYP-B2681]